jgi:drug/metabolite transporter (DMT)-like permease
MNYFIVISLIIAFLYGIIPALIKYILIDVNIMTLLLCEAIGVFLFTCLFYFYHIEDISKDLSKITWKSGYSILLLSFIVFIANILLYLILFKYDSYLVSAIISCSPVFALLVSFFIIKESITLIHLLGVTFIIAGIWCISV